jgi:hypothetical protein
MNQKCRAFRNDRQRRQIHSFSRRVRTITRRAQAGKRRHERRDKRDIRRPAFTRIDNIDWTEAKITAHALEFA